MDEIHAHHDRMAQLSRLGEHWHEKLWHGSGPWEGDKFLFLYHHPLTDKIELRYEVPNRAPELVFSIDLPDFDIDKLCTALAAADNRKSSIEDKVAAVDAHNDAIFAEQKRSQQEAHDEFTEKMLWAVRKDTGAHIAPLHITKNPARI